MSSHWLPDPSPALRDRVPSALPPAPIGADDDAVARVRVGADAAPRLEPLPRELAGRHGYEELPLELTPHGIWLRPEVIERLLRAQESLPHGFTLLILDGWRSPEFQAELLAHYEEHADADLDGFVADPDSSALIAPHTTGGAIDLTLAVDGRGVALGTDWDAFSPLSAVAALEEPGAVLGADGAADERRELARDLRRLLSSAMLGAGFAPLATEWWHWSYGEQQWAAFHGLAETLYAPIAHGPEAAAPR